MPHIDRVKYKPGAQKLIISGQNFDPAAQVLIDGAAVTIRANSPVQLLIKPLALQPGMHTVTVANPNGAPPGTATIVVD